MRPFTLLAALCLLAVLAAPPNLARAQGTTDEDSLEQQQAVQQGREALESAADFPWYDPESDSLRRIDVEPQPAPAAPRQTNSGRTTTTTANPARPWFNPGPFFAIMRWVLLAGLVFALVVALIFAVRYVTAGRIDVHGSGGEGDEDPRSQIERIENLPFRMKRTFSDLLEEARRCYDEGKYNEAIVYLYSYELVHLDKRHLIRLTKGKTNRQYVREVKPRGGISAVLAQTMLAFEEVFFGNHDLPRPQFEQCWNQLDDFHQMVDQFTAA